MRAHLKNPIYTIAIVPNLRQLSQNKRVTRSFAIKVCEVMSKYNMTRGQVKLACLYRLLNIREPTWSIVPPDVNIELAMYPKKDTKERHYKACFREMVDRLYADWELVYTDGSKTSVGVTAATVWRGVTATAILLPQASIYTVALYAIKQAFYFTLEKPGIKFVIFSNSFIV